MSEQIIELIHPSHPKEISEVKKLIQEYGQSLKINLSLQDFKKELNELPGKYSAPRGTLIMVKVNGKSAGCVALKEMNQDSCEMKRLYVRNEFRGQGIGKLMVTQLIKEAKELKYTYMNLDTLPGMLRAQEIYKSYGFYDVNPYVYNPVDGVRYMELKL